MLPISGYDISGDYSIVLIKVWQKIIDYSIVLIKVWQKKIID